MLTVCQGEVITHSYGGIVAKIKLSAEQITCMLLIASMGVYSYLTLGYDFT